MATCKGRWGIIVEHIGRNWFGAPKVLSLHPYDDEGCMFMGPKNNPTIRGLRPPRSEVWKEAIDLEYLPKPKQQVDPSS